MAVFMPISETMPTTIKKAKHSTKIGISGTSEWIAIAAIKYTSVGLTRYCNNISQPAIKPMGLPIMWLT